MSMPTGLPPVVLDGHLALAVRPQPLDLPCSRGPRPSCSIRRWARWIGSGMSSGSRCRQSRTSGPGRRRLTSSPSRSTPRAMSADWLWMVRITAQLSAVKADVLLGIADLGDRLAGRHPRRSAGRPRASCVLRVISPPTTEARGHRTSHTPHALGVHRQDAVQHRVRDLVSHLVRMPGSPPIHSREQVNGLLFMPLAIPASSTKFPDTLTVLSHRR